MSLLKRILNTFSSRKNPAIVTRIAPSPTGKLHLGTARSALFNYLYAKKHGGRFILRIEDTDRQRSEDVYEKDILDGLAWLGLEHDALYRQSERTRKYRDYLSQLITRGRAYRSREESKANPGEKVEVIRLRNPGTRVVFDDMVRGRIETDTSDLGDFVIARNIDEPLYHLAVVVDDYEMGITDVIRGEDHISNTPRQILIQEALGVPRPRYAHIPLILASDRSKLSKRKGAVPISDYRERGYLSEAMVNYLALLGWNPGTDQELFTLQELIRAFAISKIQHGGAVFDTEKLNWFNRAYMKRLSKETFLERTEAALPEHVRKLPGYDRTILQRIIPIIQERIATFSDVAEYAEAGEFTYYFSRPEYKGEQLVWKNADTKETKHHLETIRGMLAKVPENRFSEESLRAHIWSYATEEGRGNVLWPLRYALSGRDKSPDPFTLAAVLGKVETLARVDAALEKLQ